jgi:tetratricopeptide (TPR) repeat protein
MATPALSEADTLCDQAKALLKERKFADAQKLYEQAVARDSRSIPAHEGAAATAFALKDYQKAATHYKKLSTLDVRRAEPLINLGAVYNRLGDFGGAARTLRQALSKDRKSAAGYYNLGIAYKGQNQHSMCISAYKEALRLDPKMYDAHLNLANLYVEVGNFHQAIIHFEKSLEIEPKFEKAKRGLEKAREAQEEAKRSQNPFGRLVNEEEVAKHQTEVKYRDLSQQERFEDRQQLHQLAKEAESLATLLVAQLHEEVIPAVLRLQQISVQADDARAMYRESQHASTLVTKFLASAAALRDKSDSVRAHEKAIRT